jgi:tripeptidyl-peptidase-1
VTQLTLIVSDPSHQRYGQHLSQDEISNLVRPTDEALVLVHEWLLENGIDGTQLEYSLAKDWITVTLPISAAERLLDTQYSTYQHEDGDYLVRTPEWSLPHHLHEHISVIQPTNSFFRTRQLASTVKVVPLSLQEKEKIPPAPPNLTAACDTSLVTPTCLRTLYGTIDYIPRSAGKNKMGLNDFLAESNNRSDVHLFLSQFRPEAAAAAFTFNVITLFLHPKYPILLLELCLGRIAY